MLRCLLFSIGALAGLMSGCVAGAPDDGRDADTHPIRLRPGESAVVTGAALTIGFDAVTSDSRCAKGDVCVWEGDATIRVWLRGADAEKETRELHTSSRVPGAAEYAGWSVRLLVLDPYPVTGHAVPQGEYVVTLELIRGPAAPNGVY